MTNSDHHLPALYSRALALTSNPLCAIFSKTGSIGAAARVRQDFAIGLMGAPLLRCDPSIIVPGFALPILLRWPPNIAADR